MVRTAVSKGILGRVLHAFVRVNVCGFCWHFPKHVRFIRTVSADASTRQSGIRVGIPGVVGALDRVVLDPIFRAVSARVVCIFPDVLMQRGRRI